MRKRSACLLVATGNEAQPVGLIAISLDLRTCDSRHGVQLRADGVLKWEDVSLDESKL